jgi:hypothetical protein
MRPDRVQIEPAGVTAGKSFSGSNTLLKKFVTLGRFFSYARAASRAGPPLLCIHILICRGARDRTAPTSCRSWRRSPCDNQHTRPPALPRQMLHKPGMMSESEKAPSVGLRKTPGIFHGGIDAVKWPIEETPPGRFCSGAVRKRRVKNQGQLFYNERAFREVSGLLISLEITSLHINVVEF